MTYPAGIITFCLTKQKYKYSIYIKEHQNR